MKPFKESKVGKILGGKGVDTILGIAGMIYPPLSALDAVKDIIMGDKNPEVKFSPEEKVQFLEAFQEYLKEYELEIADRTNARSREVELGKAGVKNHTQNALAYIGVIGFFLMVGFLLIKGMKTMTTEEGFIIGNVTGIVGSIATGIFAYYFGSSKGSKDNADAIRKKLTDGN